MSKDHDKQSQRSVEEVFYSKDFQVFSELSINSKQNYFFVQVSKKHEVDSSDIPKSKVAEDKLPLKQTNDEVYPLRRPSKPNEVT